MKLFILVLAVLIQTATIAQSVEELDKKAGFKEFRIGDTLTTHQDKIKFMKVLDNADTKLYLVKNQISVKAYTGEVELEFYKGKVQEIIVSFKNSTPAGFDDILKSLETLYGKSEKGKDKTPPLDRFEKIFVWSGQKIMLRLGYDENYKLTEMVFTGHDSLEKLKSEF
ncbi:MAG TPA: hypothetical protein VG737_14490 [Cyclobacteriaceae bacterium]|nr:hypothetical protein [Cyclobacteriaceae bacterium]